MDTKEETIHISHNGDNAQNETIKQFFKTSQLEDDKPTVEQISLSELEAKIKQIDHEALNKVLLDTLNPHLGDNERQKRHLKEELVKFIKRMLTIQLIFVAVPIVILFACLCINIPFLKDIEPEIIPPLLSFLKYYITAIIAELLAMLFFIVKFVFDKSIVDLVKEMVRK